MSGNFILDLVLLVVVWIAFTKLRNQLGHVDKEESEEEIIKRFFKHRTGNDDTLKEVTPSTTDTPKINLPEDLTPYIVSGQNIETLLPQLTEKFVNHSFDLEKFLRGCRQVYSLVIENYAKGSIQELKPLTDPAVFQEMQQKILARQEAKHQLHNSIIGIKEIKIKNIEILETKARINLQIVSEQINYVEDEQQHIIKGSKTEILKLTDSWYFEKDFKSTTNSWLLVAIQDNDKK